MIAFNSNCCHAELIISVHVWYWFECRLAGLSPLHPPYDRVLYTDPHPEGVDSSKSTVYLSIIPYSSYHLLRGYFTTDYTTVIKNITWYVHFMQQCCCENISRRQTQFKMCRSKSCFSELPIIQWNGSRISDCPCCCFPFTGKTSRHHNSSRRGNKRPLNVNRNLYTHMC